MTEAPTRRQLEYLVALGNGLSIEQIAELACVERKSVVAGLARARQRTGAVTNTQCIVMCIDTGELVIEDGSLSLPPTLPSP